MKPSRKAERWVPPSEVYWPLTKEKKVSLKRGVWVKAISRKAMDLSEASFALAGGR